MRFPRQMNSLGISMINWWLTIINQLLIIVPVCIALPAFSFNATSLHHICQFNITGNHDLTFQTQAFVQDEHPSFRTWLVSNGYFFTTAFLLSFVLNGGFVIHRYSANIFISSQ